MKKLLVLLLTIMPVSLMGHPGHDGAMGDDGYTIIHLFNSPVHYISLVTLIVAIGVIYYLRKRLSAKTNANA